MRLQKSLIVYKVFDVLSLSNHLILVCSFICHLVYIRVCLSMDSSIFNSCSIQTFLSQLSFESSDFEIAAI